MGVFRCGADLMSGIMLATIAAQGQAPAPGDQVQISITGDPTTTQAVTSASGTTSVVVTPYYPGGSSSNYTFSLSGFGGSSKLFRPSGSGEPTSTGWRWFFEWKNLSIGEIVSISGTAGASRNLYQPVAQPFSVTVQRVS